MATCDYDWYWKLDRWSLAETQAHLTSCDECREMLTEDYEGYCADRHDPRSPFKDLPQDLTSFEEFLQALVIRRKMRAEQVELYQELVKKTFTSKPEKVRIILSLFFWRIHRALSLKARRAPLRILERELEFIQTSYQDLLSLFGRPAFIFLTKLRWYLDGDEDKVADPAKWLADHLWRPVLL